MVAGLGIPIFRVFIVITVNGMMVNSKHHSEFFVMMRK